MDEHSPSSSIKNTTDANVELHQGQAREGPCSLDQCAQWLMSISKDAKLLKHTREYRDFIKATERMERAHRQISNHRMVPLMATDDASFDLALLHSQSDLSLLQHIVDDDIILRVLDFAESRDLVQVMKTCSRFRELAEVNAKARTKDMTCGRQLETKMQLLRAKEQIEGIGTGLRDVHVPVPLLLLSRRVLVSGSGDPEYNGVYFCTGSNGNGFVFTKPRYPEVRVERIISSTDNETSSTGRRNTLAEVGFLDAARVEGEVAQPGQLLRCIIAKRFSNETILWYLSKEVIVTEDNRDIHRGDVTQVFSFWAKLMVIGDASPDICRYPSQTSILSRHDNRNDGWQNLSTTPNLQPPIVELLD